MTKPAAVQTSAMLYRPAAICAGVALESYDWVLYALLVNYFAVTFFGGDIEGSLVYGFGVFAAGFLARPIGGLVVGRLADRNGRRAAMLVCIALSGVASLGMAALPGIAIIGAWSPALLLVLRLLLGFAQGGELPVAQTYLYEMAPVLRRSLFASMVYTFAGLGKLVANLIAVGLVAVLGAEAVSRGYWRIPFLLAGIASVVFFVFRMRLPETAEFEHMSRTTAPMSLWRARRELALPMLSVVGLTAGVTAAFYLWSAVPSNYAISVLHLSDSSVLLATCAATAVFVIGLPLFGLFGDRIGARTVLLGGSAVMAAVTVPLQYWLDRAGVATYWFVVITGNIGLAAMLSVFPAVAGSVVPTRYRAVGQGLPYGVTVAVFGGTTPLLKHATGNNSLGFAVYITLLLVVTAATVAILPPASDHRRKADLGRQSSPWSRVRQAWR
ncbi:MFS transporter [Nocardia australiensis]|uniref:MFS transporter n=1 Tax=Nocardia australiensis TaxID=2887191 RepID=UPI001D147027|nr:MFS transporter [Nocardia australiensis]